MTEEEAKKILQTLRFCDCGRITCEESNEQIKKAKEVIKNIKENKKINRFITLLKE